MTTGDQRGVSLHTKILLALVAGATIGSLTNFMVGGKETPWLEALITYVFNPIGQIFLAMLFMTVIPLVFSSLALGVAQLGGGKDLGRIGLKTFAFFLFTMTMAVLIGLTLVNTIKPGEALSDDVRSALMERFGSEANKKTGQPSTFGIQTFINIVPRNPLKAFVEMDMLAVVCFSLFIGIAITKLTAEKSAMMRTFLESINELMIVIIGWAMIVAPFGVFALIFSITARFGYGLLQTLGWYVAVVIVGLCIQMFVVMPILLATLARYSPLKFFTKVRPVMITAFSTSSSNATLPTSIKISEEELGIPPSIAGFVLPLGATMNMNGTALFEGVTVVFLAQVFGLDLSIGTQAIVVILSVLTAVGAAGVPGGSLPLLALVLTTVNVPSEGIALVLGVDRILDMCRTTLNATADVVAALFIARSEGVLAE